MSHLKQAFRQVVLRPALSVTIIVMLAVGIGATTAIFTLFHQVLVRPLPVPEPDRLVNVVEAERAAMSYPMFRELEAEQPVFAGIAGFNPFQASLVHGGAASSVPSLFVSGAYFQTLSVQPALGRLIGPQDEPRIDESPVVVLGHALWQSRFGGDPGIIGQALTINGQSLTVVGVAPAAFAGTQLGVQSQLFVPLTMRWLLDPTWPREMAGERNAVWLLVFGRLGPSVTLVEAAAGLNTVHRRILDELEVPPPTATEQQRQAFQARRIELVPGARGQGAIPGAEPSLTLLFGVTLLVLLIVCVNIANLLLARGASRAGEMAVRESMGASRGRLVAQLLTEAAVPAAIGGALSLPVAAATIGAIMPILPARLADGLAIEVGAEAVLFALVATVTTTLLFGLLPALRTSRTELAFTIKGQAAQAVGGHRTARTRGALATAQIAFSTVLLVLAGLFAQSLSNVARIDLGMDVGSLVSFNVPPRVSGYSAEQAAALYERLEQELAAYPGVTRVSSAAFPVMAGANFRMSLDVEGFENEGERASASFNIVGPGFFETLSIPVLRGREFTAADVSGPARVAIVNEAFAREYVLDGNAIGKRLGPPNDADRSEIVGVIADAAYSDVKAEIPPQIFFPRLRDGGGPFAFFAGSASIYVRTAIDPDALVLALPRVVAGVDPTLPVGNVITMRRQAQESIFVDRLVTILSTSFAGLATLLAAIGLYGVLAYNVAQRTRELGLRLALGAEPDDLRALVLKQVAWMASIGIVIGVAVAIAAGHAAETLLYGVSGREPLVLVAAAVVLAAIVLFAGYVPARRASRLTPMEALRYE